jgi:hypothetical protein
MNSIIRGLAFLTFVGLGGCMQITEPIMDSTQQYLQRADSVTLSAGNAKEVNTRIHEIDPWPRYAGNNVISTNGERMAGAAERYRDVSKLNRTPQPLPTVGSASGGGSSPSPAPGQ